MRASVMTQRLPAQALLCEEDPTSVKSLGHYRRLRQPTRQLRLANGKLSKTAGNGEILIKSILIQRFDAELQASEGFDQTFLRGTCILATAAPTRSQETNVTPPPPMQISDSLSQNSLYKLTTLLIFEDCPPRKNKSISFIFPQGIAKYLLGFHQISKKIVSTSFNIFA